MANKSAPKLLVVEDDEGLQRQLKWSYEDYEVLCAGDRRAAIELLRAHEPAVVTLDLGLPPDPDGTTEGFATLEEILSLKPDTKVIVASGHGARESALRAIALGAYDFYQKPVDIDQLGLIVQRAFHLHAIETENRLLGERDGHEALGGLITSSDSMLRVCRMIERVANTDVSVMLLGASGTGKEVLARGLHDSSGRKGAPFVAINCAAIPENLLEAELFGYEKGAFTGAVKTTEGKIELAEGGTLFLDEVGDIPLPLQVKLLRFLQERVIERIGGRRTIAVDVRIVCATHQDLKSLIREGRFREDLYYRLAEITLNLPPLRDRQGDAALLAHAFVRRFASEQNRAAMALREDALRAISAHRWPGNVRELENCVKRAVIMADGNQITAADLTLDASDDEPVRLDLRLAREEAEKRVVISALGHADGNVVKAADMLGVSRPTLYDLMHRLGLR